MSIKVQGMDSFTNNFNRLAGDIQHINNMALYDAADVVADAIGEALQNLPTYDKWYGTDKYPLYGATPEEKAQIIENFGVSTFDQSDDGTKVSIGFTGYVNTKSTRFNDHVPTGLLMQCIEYGTRFRKGTHTLKGVENKVKDQAIQRAEQKITEEINKIMEE